MSTSGTDPVAAIDEVIRAARVDQLGKNETSRVISEVAISWLRRARSAVEETVHATFQEARSRVTPETPCAGCGKPLSNEFFEGEFDGVITSKLQPFHHGCEDE